MCTTFLASIFALAIEWDTGLGGWDEATGSPLALNAFSVRFAGRAAPAPASIADVHREERVRWLQHFAPLVPTYAAVAEDLADGTLQVATALVLSIWILVVLQEC